MQLSGRVTSFLCCCTDLLNPSTSESAKVLQGIQNHHLTKALLNSTQRNDHTVECHQQDSDVTTLYSIINSKTLLKVLLSSFHLSGDPPRIFFYVWLWHTRTGNYGISEFDWIKYWSQSRFSHLDRLHFAVKKLQAKIQKYWLFSSKLLAEVPKSMTRKKVKRTSKVWQIYVQLIAVRKQIVS